MSTSMAAILTALEPQIDIDLELGTARIGDADVQQDEPRVLARALGGLIYERFHVGHQLDDGLDVSDQRDTAYETRLAERLATYTWRQPVRLFDLDDTSGVVEHMGLRVRADRNDLTLVRDRTDVAQLDVPMLSPALSPGFALARGPERPTDGGPMLRLYVGSADRADATAVFLEILRTLRDRKGWQAKVASQKRLYPRSDAVTVYLRTDELAAVSDVVRAASRAEASLAPASHFTHQLATGVACAWEPDDPRPGQGSVSFGQHRAGAVAHLLVARAQGSFQPDDTRETCHRNGIDPDNVWRNLTSPALNLLRRPVQGTPAVLAGTI